MCARVFSCRYLLQVIDESSETLSERDQLLRDIQTLRTTCDKGDRCLLVMFDDFMLCYLMFVAVGGFLMQGENRSTGVEDDCISHRPKFVSL